MKKLQEFLDTQHNLQNSRHNSYYKAIKNFDRAAKKEFEECYLNSTITHAALNSLQKEYAASTWNTWLTCYKRYAKWLNDPDDTDCPKVWRKIKPLKIDWEEKLKNKWYTEEEVLKIIDKTDSFKDKAMYGVMIEGALRPGEALGSKYNAGMKVGDCKPASYGFDVTVSGKTGTSTFPVVVFAPLLKQWLNLHPYKNDKNAALWPTKRHVHQDNTINESQFNATLDFKRYCKLAGVDRPKTVRDRKTKQPKTIDGNSLHILRHTKISWTAKDNKVGVSDEMAKKMFRWSKNSRMYSRYSHLFGIDSKKTFLALAGVKDEVNAKPSLLVKRKCLNCHEENSVDALYCLKCGTVLDSDEAKLIVERKKAIDFLMKKYAEEAEKKIKG